MQRAIKNHLVDFIAIIVLIVLAAAVSGYILSHERLSWPWSSQYTLNAEFQTGQAVTPGQGQTVRVSGVQIGQVGTVTLKSGIAVVQMNIDPKYSHLIHTNATALLRPKTGLKDMFIELNPGTANAPVAKQGFTIPVSNTNPDINPDEVLASLDSDTRAYLDLLVNGAGKGLEGNGGSELAQLLERFLPTHRDLARLNSVVAERQQNLQRLIHSLQVLNTALAHNQGQIVQLIDSSSQVFHAFANANQGVSQAVHLLPGTLQQATQTLQKVQTFANIVAPATHNLLPAVSEIPAANQATIDLAKPITPVLKTEIRPFVVAARPLVRDLKPASQNLAKATPSLSNAFVVLNHLFNELSYFPGGSQHGYLWWLAWGDHNARSVFATQDANGDFRSLFLQASCATLSQVVQNLGPLSAVVLNVGPILSNSGLCPGSGGSVGLAKDLRAYELKQRPGAPTVATSGPSAVAGKTITRASSSIPKAGH
jgi:phospholipid/cholesterol/gamma-HCH transport system substrate-binding protein